MYLAKDGFFDGGRREPIRSSKGYPERRDPQAENPKGLLNKDAVNHKGGMRKLGQRYTR